MQPDILDILQSPSRRFSRVALQLALAIYAVSFLLPAYEDRYDNRLVVHPGWSAFLQAMLWLEVAWLANPAFWTAVILVVRGRPRLAFASAASGALLAARFLVDQKGIDSLRVGYYVWLASMIVLIVAAVFTWGELSDRRKLRSLDRPQ